MILNENHLAKISSNTQIYIFIVKCQHPSLVSYPLQLGYQEVMHKIRIQIKNWNWVTVFTVLN